MSSIDELISASLLDLAAYIAKNAWRGREREVVSLYAFGFLAPRATPHGALHHMAQIAIEGSVIQQSGAKHKDLVGKDLVI